MSRAKRYMALDFGTANGMAMAGLLDGGRLTLEPMHRFEVRATGMLGTSYWDFPAMLINAKRGLAACAAKFGPDLDGVACASWGSDFGLLDKNGQLLANPVHHLDQRTEGLVEKFAAVIPGRSLYQRTGIRSRREATLFQLHAMALANSPLLDKAVTMLLMADLVSYFLSGTPVQEYTLATTTEMYDAESRDWSRDTILAAKIPPIMVPEIVAPGTVIGPLWDGVAAECGLGQVPVIAPASHAYAGAMAAAPAQGDDWACIVSGEWDQVGVELAAPLINDDSFGAEFSNEGGVDGSIRLVRGLVGLALLEACFSVWAREDGADPDVGEILEQASAIAPLRRLVNPDDPRLADTADMPNALNILMAESGQPLAETRAGFARLCVDSLVMSHRHALEQLGKITGRKYGVVHLVGWGSGISLLSQSIADAVGVPVRAGPSDARTVGNILMQALALGDLASLAEAREVVRNSFEIAVHEPESGAVWDEGYGRFLKML